MSVPTRSWTYRSALLEEWVKRGSTLITFAPRSCALSTHLKEMGWFSAGLLPIINTQSLFARSFQ